MATNFIYDPTAVHKKAGEYAALRRVSASAGQVSAEYFFDLPAWEKLSAKHDQGIDEFKNAHGDVINTDNGDVKSELKFTLSQDDANTMNFLMNETSNQPFAFFIHRGAGSMGKQEFVYYPFVKISTSTSEDYPGRNVEMTCTPLACPVTWNASSLTSGSVTSWKYNVSSLSSSLSGTAGTYCAYGNITG